MFGLFTSLVADMQGKLKWNLLVWPDTIAQGNCRTESFKIQKMQRVFQIFQECFNLYPFDMRLTGHHRCFLNFLLRRQWVIVRDF